MRQSKWITLLLFLIFLAGLAMVLYPAFSNYWNRMHQSRVVASYAEMLLDYDPEEYAAMIEAAEEYNKKLVDRENPYSLSETQRQQYGQLLNLDEDGVMGYISVPSVEIQLPIYHGTSDRALQWGAGHLDWTSLPVGGESTHSVLSSHRGLPSARLFTDLDKLMVGDIFLLQILDRTMTYEVDQINIVLPEDGSTLRVEKGKDYCTLVTCTPYGVNTHRLLVRGHRIENAEETRMIKVVSEAFQIAPLVIAPLLALPMLFLLLIALMIEDSIHKKRQSERASAGAPQEQRPDKGKSPGRAKRLTLRKGPKAGQVPRSGKEPGP